MAGVGGREEVARMLEAVGLALRESPAAGRGIEHLVEGDTFRHRDLIKRAGGRWSSRRRVWVFRFDGGAPPPGLAEAPAGFEQKARPHYLGHRDRLRTRFVEARPEALADYELLEMLLFFSIYRRDTKPLAKELIGRFGSLGGVLAAEPARYAECQGLVRAAAAGADGEPGRVQDDDLRFTQVLLKAIHALLQRVLKEQIVDRPVVSSWTGLIDYLQLAMAHEPTEHFRILFLDRKNLLIKDEVQSRGTVDHTPLYPREVVKRALELSASAIIMVHNHPSGDPTPSKADIEMTRQVINALAAVDITVHDHVIIGKNRHTSFKSSRLI
ncbi:MAG TPA: JAB domain-containing protein [Geminicoccaceae bacterium]|nr:JAB domain-containing protein [Geminicoccaceae bacterium]